MVTYNVLTICCSRLREDLIQDDLVLYLGAHTEDFQHHAEDRDPHTYESLSDFWVARRDDKLESQILSIVLVLCLLDHLLVLLCEYLILRLDHFDEEAADEETLAGAGWALDGQGPHGVLRRQRVVRDVLGDFIYNLH